jgi:hypothetical protein
MKNVVYIFYEKMSLSTPYSLDLFQIYTKLCFYNMVIRKVRKTQNPEFGHTQGEIKKKPAKKYISIQRGMKLRKPSILVVY